MTTISSILLILSGLISFYCTHLSCSEGRAGSIGRVVMYLRSVVLLSCGIHLIYGKRLDEVVISVSLVAFASAVVRMAALTDSGTREYEAKT